jgi:hypothetical protein
MATINRRPVAGAGRGRTAIAEPRRSGETGRMARRLAFLTLLLGAIAGPALASDYVVVASTDPAVHRGLELTAGQRLALAPGRTATLMHASGDILVLRGSATGAVTPRARSASQAEADRLAVLRLLVSTTPKTVVAETNGRTRALCPPPGALVTLDGIAEAGKAGCTDAASAALDAYVAKAAAQ